MSAMVCYFLWQLPGWVAAGLVLGWLVQTLGLAPWLAAGLLALLVAKDVALYPILRDALGRPPLGARPIGARGEAVEPLAPSGYIRVNGELWRAELDSPDQRVDAGTPVIIRSARGLVLRVEAVSDPS